MIVNNKKEVYLKYLTSLTTILILIDLSMFYIYFNKTDALKAPFWLISVGAIILAMAFASLAVFCFIKIKFILKKEFEFTSKEKLYFIISFLLYWIVFIQGLIFIIYTCVIKNNQIYFIVSLIVTLLLSIAASVIEFMARIRYQVYLNQQVYLQENALNNESESLKENVIEIKSTKNNKRTKEAQDILDKKNNNNNKENPFKD